MPSGTPLCTALSQVLVAHTIELDNEFEQGLLRSGERARVASVVMWSNFLRFVGDGITVRELTEAAGLPKRRVLSNIGGMERWGYVVIAPTQDEPPPTERREGRGSSRGLHGDWFVRPAPAGRAAQEIWPTLFDEIDARWSQRFGTGAVEGLRSSLQTIVHRLGLDLPEYLPILASTDGLVAGVTPGAQSESAAPSALNVLLAQVLLAYTLEFEQAVEPSLPLSANFVRVLGEAGMLVREIPEAAGVSKEATSIALTALRKAGCVAVEGSTAATKTARLTAKGEEARSRLPRVHDEIEAAWSGRLGSDETRDLAEALGRILEHGDLAEGLRPDPGSWRAHKPYLARTEALLASPQTVLPHYPMVLYRGGWPDGS